MKNAPELANAIALNRRCGYTFDDAAKVTAAIERLVFQRFKVILETAYLFSNKTTNQWLDETEMQDVLISFLVLFKQGHKFDATNPTRHDETKKRLYISRIPAVFEFFEFSLDAFKNSDYEYRMFSNPFRQERYSFQFAKHVMEYVGHVYGKWQANDCRAMRDDLIQCDIEGTGRVRIDHFYQSSTGGVAPFRESIKYLRDTGALEEVEGKTPHVRIPNYLLGPLNCIYRTEFYSVCCVSDCEEVMADIEAQIGAPVASAGQLLSVIANLSSSTIDAPRTLALDLIDKMYVAAGLHGGNLPLHGRLFSQWLHFAFPYDCPYPHHRSAHFLSLHTLDVAENLVSGEEMKSVIEERANDVGGHGAALAQWTDDEVVPLFDEIQPLFTLSDMVRSTALFSLCLFIFVTSAGLRILRVVKTEGVDDADRALRSIL